MRRDTLTPDAHRRRLRRLYTSANLLREVHACMHLHQSKWSRVIQMPGDTKMTSLSQWQYLQTSGAA